MSKKDSLKLLVKKSSDRKLSDNNPAKDAFIIATNETDISTEIHNDNNIEVEKYTNIQKDRLTLPVSSDLHAQIKIYAAVKRRKMNDVVETALRKYLADNP